MKLTAAFLTAALAGGLATTMTDSASIVRTIGGFGPGAAAELEDGSLVAETLQPRAEDIAQQIREARPQPRTRAARAVTEPPPPPFMISQVQPSAPPPVGDASPEQTDPADQVQPTPPPEPEVDESALRYFAARGDRARLEAEIARLRALYPNWTPPADPLAIPENLDRQLEQMWQLYSEGRYAEVRKAIAERQSRETGWQPPADLLERIEVAEARARLVNASDLKQYATVIDVGASTPSLLNCGDVDVLWRIAEAFIRTDRQQRGIDAYTYILSNCTNPEERTGTVQKAAELLPYETVQPLLALEKPDPSGVPEFDPIRNDLARRFVAESNEKPELQVDPEHVERLRRLAEREQLPADTLLLGWHYLRRNDMAEAEKWFRASNAKEKSASASQGLALTLIARNAPAEAEEVMYEWREDSEEAKATYLAATANLLAGDPPPSLPEPVLQRVAAFIVAERYVPTAQQFGWYARVLNQLQTALRWFETALQWKPDDEPSAYGLVITRQQLNDRAGVAEIQRTWAGRSERIANLGLVTSRTPATASATAPASAAPSVNQQETTVVVREERVPQQTMVVRAAPTTARRSTVGCSTTSPVAGISPAQALARGWCLMDLNRPLEAADAFEAALSSETRSVREDAAYGQSLAYLRLGLTNKAAVAATKAPQTSQRAVELQLSILADRAITAFDAGRHREALLYLDQRSELQAESTDLMVLRGYSYMNLKMYRDALRIFEAVAATGNRDANRGLADVRLAMSQ